MQDEAPNLDPITGQPTQWPTGLTIIRFGERIQDMAKPGYTGAALKTNLPIGTPLGRKLLMKAAGESDIKPETIKGGTIEVVYFLAQQAQVMQEKTNKVEDVIRLTLFTPQGTCCAFTSWNVARIFDMVLTGYGNGPWNPPLICKVDNLIMGNQRTYSFEVLEEGI